MADTKTSALPNATALGGTEQLPGVQSAGDVNITPAQLKTFTSASPTLVTPALGTPSSGTLTNCTGLPAAGVVGSAAVLGANTFTALQTITQAAANAGIIASTGYSLTGADATGMLDFVGTLNTTGNPIAFKLALTNTASGATTKFLSFLAGAAGATEQFSVDKAGLVTSTKNAAHAFSVTVSGQNPVAFGRNSTVGGMSLFDGTNATPADNNAQALLSASKLMLTSAGVFGFSSSNVTQAMDAGIARAAAAIIDINNGTAGGGGAFRLNEMAAPAAPAADKVVIYAVDNGAGKTQLMALFSSGAAQQIAIQP